MVGGLKTSDIFIENGRFHGRQIISAMTGKGRLHEAAPVAIELPPKAVLEVVETEPTVKGQTAASSYKPALLSNGVRTMVPPFVTIGTKIVVMTADGSYVERAKD